MTSHDPLDPGIAAARIIRAQQQVRLSRRWHIGSMIALGLATLGYFVLMAFLSPRNDTMRSPVLAALVVGPSVLVSLLLAIRRRHPPASGRRLRQLERVLGWIYVTVLLPAGILTLVLPHPWPAILIALVPAAPCFAGAWLAAQR